MTTLATNLKTGATTRYTGYDFNSMFLGHDGRYYGVKADGLYLLEGKADSEVDFGDLDFGTSQHKKLVAAYISGRLGNHMTLKVFDYEYQTRSYDPESNTQRFDPGKGFRENYFPIRLANNEGADFTIDSLEITAVASQRRI